MPRPLLEIWRKLNFGHDREPSSLLQQAIAEVERELSSPAALKKRTLLRAISRRPLSLAEQVVVDMDRKPLSPMQKAIAAIAREERASRLQQESDVARRVLGTPRPLRLTNASADPAPVVIAFSRESRSTVASISCAARVAYLECQTKRRAQNAA
ncbi:hypothetical protein [Bradyrhizobium lablabi]|uniref:hypothetical protein n=1 Tax=Bradyrhizobium lablabi TaxID=722472 RepID=UPI001BACA6C8|nr:hypothetical protein [Bradyrhizobium lablabi]MBR0694282.1 hypothetical protein [Bradyrhizobium lablabi]